ncbi:tRNA (adenosine(37)-N6)-threonylcarbamoyltransferase complex dimerization subunit type 1 TsaB [Anaerorhabdus sp.]|uniref:tRNA (adenosine(37)-N6)-threonylcarbamoyltransferase complex dimerization subunit type 1 TsaB n=1 Tax=Anaerorhabdus sp. TaxID=1872524 RepID=UPI002FC6A244
MITLCMDTSHKHLTLALIKDDALLASSMTECFKQQSETIFPELEVLCKEANVQPSDINQIVIASGPGSYTGVRIAMTIAKVFCATKDIPCYTLNTLQLYSGNHDNCCVLLDARGKRAYFGKFNKGVAIEDLGVYTLDEISAFITNEEVLGDGTLIGREDIYVDLAKSFLDLKPQWKKVENIHLLVPEYLKSSDEYLVK